MHSLYNLLHLSLFKNLAYMFGVCKKNDSCYVAFKLDGSPSSCKECCKGLASTSTSNPCHRSKNFMRNPFVDKKVEEETKMLWVV